MNLNELAKETAERISVIAYCPADDNDAEVPIEEATKLIESALVLARKQGMTDAAEIVEQYDDRAIFESILSARDRLEQPTKQ